MTMNKSPSLLAAAVAFAFTAGSAHAASSQRLPGSLQPTFPALVTDSSKTGAPAAKGSSAAPLGELLREWDRAGLSTPTKPAQARIYGRPGHATSGGEYHAMVSLIRSAIRDSAENRDQVALTKIAKARTLLSR